MKIGTLNFPTILYTERPDNASTYINRGHVVLLMESSAACLIVPLTFGHLFITLKIDILVLCLATFQEQLLLALFLTTMISALYVAS